MSPAHTPPRRGISPWWALLLLTPVPFVAGWLIADLPSSPHPAAVPVALKPIPAPDSAPAPDDPAPGTADPHADDAPDGGVLTWTTLDDAMQLATHDHKAVLIDFNAEWCGPCQHLRQSVFEDPAIAPRLGRKVVGVSIVDRVREDGQNSAETERLQQRYEIRAFPTLVMITPNGDRTEKLEGYYGPQGTRDWILSTADAMR